jgi:hypothetical protein
MSQPSICAIVLTLIVTIVLMLLFSCPCIIVLISPIAIVLTLIVETHPVVLLSPWLLLSHVVTIV